MGPGLRGTLIACGAEEKETKSVRAANLENKGAATYSRASVLSERVHPSFIGAAAGEKLPWLLLLLLLEILIFFSSILGFSAPLLLVPL